MTGLSSRLVPRLAAVTVAAACSVPTAASAFCGFYVSGADGKLFNKATQVVLMREGTRTVLSMQNDYEGPAKGFAMVVPVPTVLKKEQVKTLDRKLFERVDKLSAPRLVEYWEKDPCRTGIGLGSFGTLGHGGGGTGQGFGSGLGRLRGTVKVEAKFSVDEYDIVILSAKDSTGLDAWLRANEYNIPKGAEAVLKPYVTKGMKFFVAKVDPARVKKVNGRTVLAPLRFYYDSDTFTLPTRLGLLNSAGTQDLIVNVLAKGTRYQAANYDNVTIPTNIDVGEITKEQFGSFYASLFDDTVKKHAGAVITEYAWDSGTCDPCSTTPLSTQELATLGADVLSESGIVGRATRPMIRSSAFTAKGPLNPQVVRRIARRNHGRLRLCYQTGLSANPKLAGAVKVTLTIDKKGGVGVVKASSANLGDAKVLRCIEESFRSMNFPDGDALTVASTTYDLRPTGGAPPGGALGGFGGRNGFVLTRLHLRYTKDALGEDLVFRKAQPIVGGREFLMGKKREQGARKGSINNFQGRYAIRHPWKGEIKCDKPRRGVWGGPPKGIKPEPKAALQLAYAKRDATLVNFVAKDAELAVLVRKAGSGEQSTTSTVPVASASPAASAGPAGSATPAEAPAPKPSGQACGCRTVGSSTPQRGVSIWVLAFALALGSRRRR